MDTTVGKGMRITLAGLIAALVWGIVPAQSQTGAILSVNPPLTEVPLGSQAQVELLIISGLNVNAFDFTLEYDTNVLTLASWSFGDYLSNLFIVKKVEEPGVFRLACTQLATPAASGDGVLVRLNFTGKVTGSSSLVISQAEFADSSGILTIPTLENGGVNVVSAATYTPTATSELTQTSTPTATPVPDLTATTQPAPTQGASQAPTMYPAVTSTPTAVSTSGPPAPPPIPGASATFTATASASYPISTLALPTGTVTQTVTLSPGTATTPGQTTPFFASPTPSVPGTPLLPTIPGLDKTQQAWQEATLIANLAVAQGEAALTPIAQPKPNQDQSQETFLWILLGGGLLAAGVMAALILSNKKQKHKETLEDNDTQSLENIDPQP